jgi:site-specific DNA recombinase
VPAATAFSRGGLTVTAFRCAAYARYSTDKQNPLSIEDQVRKCREFAESHGWRLLDQHIYSDEEISGATLDRPSLRRLLEIAESPARPFDVLLVEDTSRLSRKQADILNLCERLNFAGLRICFVAQGIDSQEQKFQLVLAARGMIDQLFREDTARRVHRGMEGLVKRGLHTGGRCFGYSSRKDAEGSRLEINEAEAATVRRIFELYGSGHSLKRVARLLNGECVPSPQPQRGRCQRSWSPVAVRHVLLNPRYRGEIVWNRRHKVYNQVGGAASANRIR